MIPFNGPTVFPSSSAGLGASVTVGSMAGIYGLLLLGTLIGLIPPVLSVEAVNRMYRRLKLD